MPVHIEFNVKWRRIRQEVFYKDLFLTSVVSIAPITGSGDHAVGLAVITCKYVSAIWWDVEIKKGVSKDR